MSDIEAKDIETTIDTRTPIDDRNLVRRFFFPLRNQKGYIENETKQRYRSSWTSTKWKRQNRYVGTGPIEIQKSPVQPSSNRSNQSSGDGSFVDAQSPKQAKEDIRFVNKFWTTFDDLVILSIFTQLGILFRLAFSTWFTFFDSVFSNETSLFTTLPLNCFSCFILGMLCSGETLMEVIATRFTPARTQHEIQQGLMEPKQQSKLFQNEEVDTDDDEGNMMCIGTSIDISTNNGHTHSEFDVNDRDGIIRKTSSGLFRRKDSRRQRVSANDRCDHDDYHHRKTRSNGGSRLKRQKAKKTIESTMRFRNELRDIQILALERRIRMSKCLVLFPAEQEDVDVMEHYFNTGYRKERCYDDENDDFDHEDGVGMSTIYKNTSIDVKEQDHVVATCRRNHKLSPMHSNHDDQESAGVTATSASLNCELPENSDNNVSEESRLGKNPDLSVIIPTACEDKDNGFSDGETSANTATTGDSTSTHDTVNGKVDQMITDVADTVNENISRLQRVNLVDGWDAGTSPSAMADDLLLGLRAGFCGALSSFSSWNSAMVNLLWNGQYGEAMMGYILGLQLPIIAYRFGQHTALYVFMWRVRQQSRRAERRGYGLKISQNDDSDLVLDCNDDDYSTGSSKQIEEKEIPSVRAFVTAIFVIALAAQVLSLFLYEVSAYQQIAFSLLFSPLGVIARWRLMKWNDWRPSFPLGTFTCNLLACALGGSLGSLLAGNPGPKEAIVMVSFISGFGGTLSSVGAFIEEILVGVDPILFRFDGITYAISSLVAAIGVVMVFSTTADWADKVGWNTVSASGGLNETSSLIADLLFNVSDNLTSSLDSPFDANVSLSYNGTMPPGRFF